MTKARIDIAEEVFGKKTFVWAVDWPGWCRSGKDRDLAIASLLDHAGRYAKVAKTAGLDFPDVDDATLRTVESVEGNGGTEFGVPSRITKSDARTVTRGRGRAPGKPGRGRLDGLRPRGREAPPTAAQGTPRRRPRHRQGGRPRHRGRQRLRPRDRPQVQAAQPGRSSRRRAERKAVLDVLRQPSDGSPLADRRWTLRYAARRIAWHALDHAWEIEDRTEPESVAGRPGRRQSRSPHRRGAADDRRRAGRDSSAVAGRPQLADAGIASRLRELAAVRPSDQRVVEERRRRGAAQEPARRICAAVASSRSSPRITRSMPWRRSSTTTQNP